MQTQRNKHTQPQPYTDTHTYTQKQRNTYTDRDIQTVAYIHTASIHTYRDRYIQETQTDKKRSHTYIHTPTQALRQKTLGQTHIHTFNIQLNSHPDIHTQTRAARK